MKKTGIGIKKNFHIDTLYIETILFGYSYSTSKWEHFSTVYTEGIFGFLCFDKILYITAFFFHLLLPTDLLSWFCFNYQLLPATQLNTHSPTQTSLLRVCLQQTFLSLLFTAPQSVLLLGLHHGRMPDSLYGNLSSLWCFTVIELLIEAFNCTGPSFMVS